MLKRQGRAIEVVSLAENGQEDLLAYLTAMLSSFTAWLSGQRWAKRKTETIIRALEAGESEGEHADR
jgi:putative resolvase